MSEKRKNVLLILTDQHRADHMSCAGNPIVKTPNLDRLAQEGVRFTSAYCANPLCMPNRASIFMGMYPNVHGLRSNGINLPNRVETFVETLRKRGYVTYNVGKVHLQFYTRPYNRKDHSHEMSSQWMRPKTAQEARDQFPKPYYGFQECEIVLGHGDRCIGHYVEWLEERRPDATKWVRKRRSSTDFRMPYYETELPIEQFPTTYCKEKTVSFLERHSKGEYGDKPFFLCCSIPDPHHPACSPGKYKDMYPDVPLPEMFKDPNIKDHKFLARMVKILRNTPMLRQTTEEEVKGFTRLTYGCISLLDHAIGEILAALETYGYADDTIVVYTSDHGDLMGDHGLILKGPSPFDGVLRVPLIIKAPGLTQPGGVTNAIANSIDISKTILNYAGVNKRYHSRYIQGIDLAPVLENQESRVRDCCIIEEDEEWGSLELRLRHLIMEDYKVTVYTGLENAGDIYDRKNDPHELNNLWDKDPELREKLFQKLFHEVLKAESKYPARQTAT